MQDFKTIKEDVQAEIVEKKSRFIANMFYVANIDEANAKISEIKKKYYDAKHHCFAYRIYDAINQIERFSDDGEPQGTAGAPLLNILQKNNLSNIVVVVTRYFGGILLGTGGLVRAYSDSLNKAISTGKIIKKTEGFEVKIIVEYSEFEKFKYYCNKNNISIKNTVFNEDVICYIEAEKGKKSIIENDFNNKNIKTKEIGDFHKKIIDGCI